MAEKRPNPFQKYLDAPDIEDDTPIAPVAKRVNPFQKYLDAPDPEEAPERTIGGTIKDIGVSAAKGVVEAGEAAVGIANIPTFGYAGKTLEKVGYKPKETQDILSSQFSPAQKEANRKLEEAKGFIPTIKTAIQNPSTIGLSLVESVPSIAGGGAIARGAMKFAPKLAPLVAGAIGEGTVSAGSFAESTRQQTDDGTLSLKQTALAPVVGGLTGAFSLAGGRLAKKLGFEDIDTLIAGNKLSTDKKNIFARIIGGGISEGAFEELPQSAQEQLISNAALDRPLFDGVPEAAAMGLVTGAAMGGGVNAMPNRAQQPEAPPAAPPPAPRFLPTGPISKALSSLPVPRDIAAPPTTGYFAPGFGEVATPNTFTPPAEARPNWTGQQISTIPEQDIEAGLQAEESLRYNQLRNSQTERRSFTGTADPQVDESPYARPRSRQERQARAAMESQYDNSYALEGAPKVDYISDKAAEQFKTESLGRLQRKQWSAANKKYQEQLDQDEKTITDPKIPAQVKRDARKQAEAIVSSDPVYQHMDEAKKRGGLDLNAFKEDYGVSSVSEIVRRYPGVFSRTGTVKPDDFAAEQGYESLDDMVQKFTYAKTKRELQAKVVRELHGEWQDAEATMQADQAAEGRRTWAGRAKPEIKQPRASYPAAEQDIQDTIAAIQRYPESADEMIDHWSFSPAQKQRLVAAKNTGGENAPIQPSGGREENGAVLQQPTPFAAEGADGRQTVQDGYGRAVAALGNGAEDRQEVLTTAPSTVAEDQSRTPPPVSDSRLIDTPAASSGAAIPPIPDSVQAGVASFEEDIKLGGVYRDWAAKNDYRISASPSDETLTKYAKFARNVMDGKDPISSADDFSRFKRLREYGKKFGFSLSDTYRAFDNGQDVNADGGLKTSSNNTAQASTDQQLTSASSPRAVTSTPQGGDQISPAPTGKAASARPPSVEGVTAPSQGEASQFDSSAYDKEWKRKIAASRATGAKHADSLSYGVEDMRGRRIKHVITGEVGVITTVGSDNNVRVKWEEYPQAPSMVGEEAIISRAELAEHVVLDRPGVKLDRKTGKYQILKARQATATSKQVQAVSSDKSVTPSVASQEGVGQIIEYTTKRGKVIRGKIVTGITVQQARELDPYTFKKDGGFFVREAPSKAPASQEVKRQAPDKPPPVEPKARPTNSAKLRRASESLRAKGEEKLGQDRQSNTARRARMASNAEADAGRDIKTAATMANIATAQEEGVTEYLSGVSAKSHVDLLSTLLNQAKYASERSRTDGVLDYKRPSDERDAPFAEYPYPRFSDYNDLDAIIAALGNKRGWKAKRDELRRGGLTITGENRLALLREALSVIGDDYRLNRVGEQLKDYDRLQRIGIKSKDELEQALREFVKYSGQAPKVDKIKQMERALIGQKTGIDFFPTPKAQAKNIVDRADIKPGMKVLEPSAGTGNLAEEMRAQGGEVDVAEISSSHRDILEAKGFNIIEHDFMDMKTGDYDVIVMNPPFSKNMDIEHVRHAYTLLKPGGKIVSIMGEGAFFRGGKTETEFREWLDDVGTSEKLPEKFFMDKAELRTTGVNARIVEIEKPYSEAEVSVAYSPESSEPKQGEKSATTLSDIIAKAKDSTNPTTKQLAQLLSDFIPGSKLDTKVIIDPSIKSAKYTGKTNTITIKDHAALETSLHEIVHAVTVNEMEANPEIKRRVTRLMNTVKRKAIAQGLLSAQNITDIEIAGGSRAFKNRFPAGSLSGVENIAYAFLNEKEFLAQAFSSPQFQGLLKSTKFTDQGGLRRAFDVFVELVMKALGFKNVNGDAFSEAVKLVAELASKENVNEFAQPVSESLGTATDRIQNLAAFKKWFDGSKVVDKDGDPLVVYHGTDTKEKISSFRIPSYFTQDPDEASAYGFPKDFSGRESLRKKYIPVSGAKEYAGKMVPFVGIISDIDTTGEVWATEDGVVRVNENGTVEVFTDLVLDDDRSDYANDRVFTKEGESSAYDDIVADNEDFISRYLTKGENGRVYPVYLAIKNPKELPAFEANKFGKRLYDEEAAKFWDETVNKLRKEGYDGIVTESDEGAFFADIPQTQQWIPFSPTQIKSIFNDKWDGTNPDIMESYEESGFSEINPPTIGKTKAQIAAEREDRYAANRIAQRDFKRKAIRNARSATGKVMQGIDKFLGAASTRLKNIHPKLQEKLRDLDFFTGTNLTRDVKAVEPMLRKAKTMSKEDFADWDLARKNSDKEKIDELIKKYSLQEEYAAYREVLDRLRDEANHVGMDIGWIKEYAPRAINDAQGFLNAVGKGDMRPVITDAIEKRAKFLGISVAEMIPEMKADIVSNMLFGGWSGVGKPGNTKERTIKEIPPELNQFYMDSDAALMNYLHSIRKHVEMRKFFGKLPRVINEAKSAMHAAQARLRKATAEDEAKYMEMHEHTKGEPFPETERMKEIKDTIAQHKYVLDTYKNTRTYSENISDFFLEMQSEGIVKPEDEMTLINVLNARFHERGTYGAIQTYKNLSYIDTMGSFTSAITQIGDFVWTVYSNGWYRTAKGVYGSVTGKARIKKEDVGIERIAQEFAGTDTMSNAVAAVFKWTGLSKMDSIGKESFLNAALEKFEQRAVKDPTKLKEEIKNIFEAETDSVIADLQNKRITGNVKRLVYGNLLDFQPAALSEQSEQYMKAGNGRVFYMLKSYTLKQFDVFRREIYTGLKSGDKKQVLTSLQNFAYLTALLVVANAGADELKDFVTGRKTNFEDRVVDNVLKLFGVSKYVTWKARTEGAGTAIAKQILPPFKFVDSLYKDVMSAGDEKGLEVVNSIPIVGKLAYWHLGRGSHNRKDYAEIRFAKRRKTLNDIKDKTEQDPSLKRNYREELAELHAMERFQTKLNVKKKNINRLEAIEKRTGRDLSDRIGAAKAARIQMIEEYLAQN